MKIVLAPDKFKDSLSAAEVVDAMARGILRAIPDAELERIPMADGGEGTVEAMVAATGGRLITRRVTGALPDTQVDATFGILGDGTTAVIEMAAASGLHLVPRDERDPLHTTSFGTGELIVAAIEAGCRKIILGIGGSATVDAGIGCAQACGIAIIRNDGEPISPNDPLVGGDLPDIALMKRGRGSRVDGVEFVVACDVSNPLLGAEGAAAVYGPQKGASPQAIQLLDGALAGIVARSNTADEANTPGAGAAGGLGYAMLAFFGATLRPGIDLMVDAARLTDRLHGATLCLTGEGKFDGTSSRGKTVSGVARVCQSLNIPCIAIAGTIGSDAPSSLLTASFAASRGPATLDQSMQEAGDLVARTAEQILRVFMRR